MDWYWINSASPSPTTESWLQVRRHTNLTTLSVRRRIGLYCSNLCSFKKKLSPASRENVVNRKRVKTHEIKDVLENEFISEYVVAAC